MFDDKTKLIKSGLVAFSTVILVSSVFSVVYSQIDYRKNLSEKQALLSKVEKEYKTASDNLDSFKQELDGSVDSLKDSKAAGDEVAKIANNMAVKMLNASKITDADKQSDELMKNATENKKDIGKYFDENSVLNTPWYYTENDSVMSSGKWVFVSNYNISAGKTSVMWEFRFKDELLCYVIADYNSSTGKFENEKKYRTFAGNSYISSTTGNEDVLSVDNSTNTVKDIMNAAGLSDEQMKRYQDKASEMTEEDVDSQKANNDALKKQMEEGGN